MNHTLQSLSSIYEKDYQLSNRLDYLYGKARKMTEIKTDLKLPPDNLYSLEQILDEDWLPDITV